jgi:hypothetical protein
MRAGVASGQELRVMSVKVVKMVAGTMLDDL